MPQILNKITPNLAVADVERSIAFYRDILGFTVLMSVPEQPPRVFAILASGGVELFVNAMEAAIAEYPSFKDRPAGGTLTLFMDVTGIREAYESLKSRVTIVMPLETKWYGSTEFAFLDPDGFIITFAEREGESREADRAGG